MFVKRISSESVVIGTPAKVNLSLKVLGKRPDGYHDIDSIFQAVSLFDRLKFTRDDYQSGVEIRLTEPSELPTDETNLIAKSYRLMQAEFGLSGGLKVELEKNIPVAAGLGGGSADGAATILACTALFDLALDFPLMARLSVRIGSDLPFFFSSGQAHVTGRGDNVRPINLPTDYWIVLVTPDLAISTAEAYAALRLPLTKPDNPCSFQGWNVPNDLVKWLADTGNDFEPVQFGAHPQLLRAKKCFADSGAVLARMSGSGPTVFGIYYGMPDFDSDRVFGRTDWTISTVRPIRLPARL